jgi:hypothetical protein
MPRWHMCAGDLFVPVQFMLSTVCCCSVDTPDRSLLRIVMASAKFTVKPEDSLAFVIAEHIFMRTAILSCN